MKLKLVLGLLIANLISGVSAQAQAPAILLDLQVRGGKLADVGPNAREVIQKTLETRDQGTSVIVPAGGAKIPYKQGDPLFQSGARTWLIRCKLQSETTEGYFPLVGQWKVPTSERIIALILKGGAPGQVSFHLSPDGRVEKQVVRLLPPPPADVWVTLAASYRPGGEAALLVFDDGGKLLSQSRGGPVAPAAVLSAPVDFELSGPAKAALQISAVQIWEGVLTDEQIVRGLPALGAK